MANFGPKPQEKLPVQPLADFCNADTVLQLGRILQLDPTSIYRYMKNGIPIYKADLIACKTLGVHPGFIWKKEWVPT